LTLTRYFLHSWPKLTSELLAAIVPPSTVCICISACVCWCFCLCALVIRLVKNALPASQSALAASSLTLAHYFAKLKSLLLLLLRLHVFVLVAAFLSSILTIFTALICCCCCDAMLRRLFQLLLFCCLCRLTGLPRFFFFFRKGLSLLLAFSVPLSIHTFFDYE